MQGRDRRLDLVGPWTAVPHRLVDEGQALADHVPVPERPVLVLQQHDRAVGVEPGGTARRLQEHEGRKPHDLRLRGKQPLQQAAEPDRLFAQARAGHGFVGAGGIALVEHQVDHGRDGGEPLRPLYRARGFEGRLGAGDARLGAGDPLLHGRLADQEGAGDLFDREARHDPQGQRDLLGRRQVRVAADEHQPQDVVAVVRPVEPLGHRGLHVVHVGDGVLGRQLGHPRPAPHAVERGVAADHDQPRRRVARRPLLRPGLQRPQAGLLERLFGGIQVTEIAEQGPDRLWARGCERRFDPGEVIAHPTFASSGNSPGRNSSSGRIS